MLVTLLALQGALSGAFSAPTPAVSAASASSLNSGACSGPGFYDGTRTADAIVRVQWTLTNGDATNYDIKVYEKRLARAHPRR
jgi:hypothetical protein